MDVPLLDLSEQHAALRAPLVEAFERVLSSGTFILGPEVQTFEKDVAEAIGVKHAITMSSGSDALLAALMAIDLRPGDEVITTAYSFFATAGCIARLGATPVFVDVRPDTLNLDPADVRRRVSARTRAIIPVHLFGLPADMDEILEIASSRNLRVIEDACQAIGATYRGRAVGLLGDMATFSFFPSKNLGGFGDGGLLTTESDELAARIRMLRSHGSSSKYHHDVVGGNFRLDALQVALLRVKLPYLQGWTSARQRNAQRYSDLFRDARFRDIVLPSTASDRTHVFHQYVIGIEHRDELREWLAKRGVGTEVYYPVPLHLQKCFESLGYAPGELPHAEQSSRRVLALPIYPELRAEQQDRVVQVIADWFAQF